MSRILLLFLSPTLVLLLLFMGGCGGPEPTAPPEGWETAEDRWWTADADTSQAFRDLSSLSAMGIASAEVDEVAATRADARQSGLLQDQFTSSLLQRLEPILRNNPEEVYAIFQEHIAPEIEAMDIQGSVNEATRDYRRDAYNTIRRHYREPQTRLQLGEDIAVSYPDSLRQAGIGGRVVTQVYLNADGEPQAIKLIESVEPTLDAIAMRATTQMRWDAARLNVDGSWEEIPAWSRFTVRFAAE